MEQNEFTLYDTLTKGYVDFKPIPRDGAENLVTIYTCGPTVYSNAHIGNFRAFLFGDLLARSLAEVGGYDIKWVVNITDIDDKTITRSLNKDFHLGDMSITEDDSPISALSKFTRYYESIFLKDLEKIGIEKSSITAMPRATEYIPEMKELIGLLIEKGFAYESHGSIYFDVIAWQNKDSYGKLKNLNQKDMLELSETTQDRTDEKKSPFDFVLWKSEKKGEPSWVLEYEDKTLNGRPGWHLECSAMGKKTLGLPIDIHTGGIDLCFPHHEDELAQSKAGYGEEPVRYWMHNEFLDLDGEKMSKSSGNIWNLDDLEKNGISPMEYRFAILSQHYRKKIAFSLASCQAAAKGMEKIQNYIYDTFERRKYCNDNYCSDQKKVWIADNADSPNLEEMIDQMKAEFDGFIRNDLNTPRALAAIHSFFGNYHPKTYYMEAVDKAVEFFGHVNRIFNVFDIGPKQANQAPDIVTELAEKRLLAKKDKNWELADKLRSEIETHGYTIKDKPDGYEITEM